jgi:hypothetical protein
MVLLSVIPLNTESFDFDSLVESFRVVGAPLAVNPRQ